MSFIFFFHPSSVLFVSSVLASIALTISANSWFVAWVGLEINLLSFIPLIMKKSMKYSTEAALKYFLTQALASAFIIFSMIFLIDCSPLSPVLISGALLLKMGAAPSHQWMPSLVDGLAWPLVYTLMVIQKIGPFIMLTALPISDMTEILIYVYIFASAIIGSLGGLTQSSLRKLMVYSSIAHTAWMLSALALSSLTWILYFSVYSVVSLTIVLSFQVLSVFSLNQLLMKNSSKLALMTSVSVLSLGGLPPFTGFVPKLITTQELLTHSSFFTLLVLLAATFISLFFYTRVLLVTLLLNSAFNSFNKIKLTNPSYLVVLHSLGLLALPLFVILV